MGSEREARLEKALEQAATWLEWMRDGFPEFYHGSASRAFIIKVAHAALAEAPSKEAEPRTLDKLLGAIPGPLTEKEKAYLCPKAEAAERCECGHEFSAHCGASPSTCDACRETGRSRKCNGWSPAPKPPQEPERRTWTIREIHDAYKAATIEKPFDGPWWFKFSAALEELP